MQQFDAEQLQKSWASLVADLDRALATLPDPVRLSVPAIPHAGLTAADYKILEATCDQLDAYAKHNSVTREFCLAMCDVQ